MKNEVKVIVTTTINPPTEALERFAQMNGWNLVVVMDKKTPENRLSKAVYLTCDAQEKAYRALSDAIGWNCIQRRNIGFLYAVKEMGADIIATVDDDNIPLANWGTNLMVGSSVDAVEMLTTQSTFDPLSVTNHSNLWHRGFPIQLVESRLRNTSIGGQQTITPTVQADFWNGDPDVDAVCRMTRSTDCQFSGPFPFFSKKPSPFNSQNTFLHKSVLPHYFMFPEIGRMDDIWAAYHVLAQGFSVVYGEPSVIQKRNQHNLTKDMKGELIGYIENESMIANFGPSCVTDRLPIRALKAFRLYQEAIA